MKICVITANMGDFEEEGDHVDQSVTCDFHWTNDSNFSPRTKAMTPRMQARIVKTFPWQFAPDYDYYLWVDGSCKLSHPDSVKWFLEKLGDADIAVLKHPHRNNIQAEADYLKKRLEMNCPYITPRYENELIDEELAEIMGDKAFKDDRLFASTAFIFKDSPKVRAMMKEWWYHISRYHIIDQLGLPYVLWKFGLKVNVIPDNYWRTPYLKYTRK